MWNKFKKLETVIIISIIAIIGIVYAVLKEPVYAPDRTDRGQNQEQEARQEGQVRYQGMDGRTALDLLKVFYGTETKSTDFGEMVIGINGVSADESRQFWAFYVNGALAQEGAGTYVTKSGEVIEWKLENF